MHLLVKKENRTVSPSWTRILARNSILYLMSVPEVQLDLIEGPTEFLGIDRVIRKDHVARSFITESIHLPGLR